jgi:acetyltransferase EpsM
VTLCGAVFVGEGSQIDAGAVVIPGIKIGKWSLVAAGAVVMKDVPDHVFVIGNPARVVKNIL